MVQKYLTDRTFMVKLGKIVSNVAPITNGIPQGSPLGPLLFNVFINDIGSEIKNSEILLYADDLKLFREVNNTRDTKSLQKDLNAIVHWCSVNNMEINTQETKFICYTNKVQYYVSSYKVNNVNLARVNDIKDLGIYFDSNLKFGTHI